MTKVHLLFCEFPFKLVFADIIKFAINSANVFELPCELWRMPWSQRLTINLDQVKLISVISMPFLATKLPIPSVRTKASWCERMAVPFELRPIRWWWRTMETRFMLWGFIRVRLWLSYIQQRGIIISLDHGTRGKVKSLHWRRRWCDYDDDDDDEDEI